MGTFMYDSPSLGVVCRISWPGICRSTSLGARHSANLSAAESSASSTVGAARQCNNNPITSAAVTTAVAPTNTHRPTDLARFCSLSASAAATTRARNSPGSSAPRATSGSIASILSRRACSASSSAAHAAHVFMCSSRPPAAVPVSAASSSCSFHFTQAFVISSLPTVVFSPCGASTLLSPQVFPAPHPHPPRFPPLRRQTGTRAASFPLRARQMLPRAPPLPLWQSSFPRTRLSRRSGCYPSRHRSPLSRSGQYFSSLRQFIASAPSQPCPLELGERAVAPPAAYLW